MPKVLCMAGIVVSILVFLIFLVHLILQFVGGSLAPYATMNVVMDVVFILCAAGLGVLSWMTLREQD
ncbi:MAG: hypothetical protein KatS3mg110_1207 [Pirellulaceae bacterium]|nr:MAG: hypothetical protein KatS3mg110_1207 [Pirellulaceae bacterium]